MTARLRGSRERQQEVCRVVGRRRRKLTGRGNMNFNVFMSSALLFVLSSYKTSGRQEVASSQHRLMVA